MRNLDQIATSYTLYEYLKLIKVVNICLIVLVILTTSATSSSSTTTSTDASDEDGGGGGERDKDDSNSGVREDFANMTALTGEYGVLIARRIESGQTIDEEYCIIHYNGKNHLPPNGTEFRKLINLTDFSPGQLCQNLPDSIANLTGSVALIRYDTTICPISEQIARLERGLNGYGVLIILPTDTQVNEVHIYNNSNPNFFKGLIAESSVKTMREHIDDGTDDIPVTINSYRTSKYTVMIYAPGPTEDTAFNLSLMIIWCIAVFTVSAGSYWSGLHRLKLHRKKQNEISAQMKSNDTFDYDKTPTATRSTQTTNPDDEPSLNVSPIWICVFVIIMGCMLVSLYFFYQYLVYLIILLFVLASVISLFSCFDFILRKILPTTWLVKFIPFSEKYRPPIYQVALLMCSISIALFWLITRKAYYSWILQDTLGVFFSINMLRTIRLPSFKICFVLLALLFFYDIFFVFYSPMLTSKGESIMVEVATGGSRGPSSAPSTSGGTTGEQLPMVLKVPHITVGGPQVNPLEVCERGSRSYSLLGFGDILVPGLLVSYCHAFDLITGVKWRLYFVSNCIFYGIGLIVTYLGLYLMNGIAQPALLYLVPLTLSPPIIIALLRGEMKLLWYGPDFKRDGSDEAKSQPHGPSRSRENNSLLGIENVAVPPPEQINSQTN